jgi:hypothetical protein
VCVLGSGWLISDSKGISRQTMGTVFLKIAPSASPPLSVPSPDDLNLMPGHSIRYSSFLPPKGSSLLLCSSVPPSLLPSVRPSLPPSLPSFDRHLKDTYHCWDCPRQRIEQSKLNLAAWSLPSREGGQIINSQKWEISKLSSNKVSV